MAEGFYCQRCERPAAEFIVTDTDEATVTALVCMDARCGLVTVVSQIQKPISSDSDNPEN